MQTRARPPVAVNCVLARSLGCTLSPLCRYVCSDTTKTLESLKAASEAKTAGQLLAAAGGGVDAGLVAAPAAGQENSVCSRSYRWEWWTVSDPSLQEPLLVTTAPMPVHQQQPWGRVADLAGPHATCPACTQLFFEFAIVAPAMVVTAMGDRLLRARFPLANLLSAASVLIMVRGLSDHAAGWTASLCAHSVSRLTSQQTDN
jgi:hypothetical protein